MTFVCVVIVVVIAMRGFSTFLAFAVRWDDVGAKVGGWRPVLVVVVSLEWRVRTDDWTTPGRSHGTPPPFPWSFNFKWSFERLKRMEFFFISSFSFLLRHCKCKLRVNINYGFTMHYLTDTFERFR